jgi:hypothetical protein
MNDPLRVAEYVDHARRAGRVYEARDALHAALPWAPNDPALCFAGGELYATLGFAREAIRFYEVVERSRHAGLAADATRKITALVSDGTADAKDTAVCVLTLAEVYRTLMTDYARAWSYAHWERACLADPCWILQPTHLYGMISGGHAAPPPHPRAWWTILYAIEALDVDAIQASFGGRFASGDVVVLLQTPASSLHLSEASDADRSATFTPRKVTAIERVSEPVYAQQIARAYVAGRLALPFL